MDKISELNHLKPFNLPDKVNETIIKVNEIIEAVNFLTEGRELNMNKDLIKTQAQMFALVAEMHAVLVSVEGMKAANTERENQGFTLAYPESAFVDASKEIENIEEHLSKISNTDDPFRKEDYNA